MTTPILKEFRQVFGDPRVDDDIARVGRAGAPADIAPATLFLCSDGARWINGANLPVDGGLEASINAERPRLLSRGVRLAGARNARLMRREEAT